MVNHTAALLAAARRRAPQGHRITSLQSPVTAETLGGALAADIASLGATLIVVWDHYVETPVLGHVIARELGAELVYAYAHQGSLGLSTEPVGHTVAVVVSYDWTEDPGLDALVTMLASRGIRVAGAASVLAPTNGGRTDLPSIALEPVTTTAEEGNFDDHHRG